MATLYFSGDQVAFYDGFSDVNGATEFDGISAPFGADDLVEIEVLDQDINSNGEFRGDEVIFTRVTVIRDGIRYDFDVQSGSKIKETGGDEVEEQGDTFFTTNDEVGPPSSGPFSGLSSGNLVFATDTTFVDGQNATIDRTQDRDLNEDGDTSDSGETANAGFNASQNSSPPCYAPGKLIDTPGGPRAVDTLAVGDLVMTQDHGPQVIRWTRHSDHPLEDAETGAKPVQIKAGAPGHNLPARDLVVSPQHRILVGGFGQLDHVFTSQAFAPAKSLTAMPGIGHMQGKRQITWVHFACDRHEVVTANGCLSESLLLGPMVMNGLTARERRHLIKTFGPRPGPGPDLNGPPARACLTVSGAKRTLALHFEQQRRASDIEIRKWDRDSAFETYEAERLRDASRRTRRHTVTGQVP